MSTTEHTEARRRGRPSKPLDERKSANMKFRTREDLREKIEAAAAAAGRSASEEVEARLQHSFAIEPLHHMVFGNGDDAKRFITLILTTIRTIQEYQNPHVGPGLGTDDWRGNELESDLTRAALRSALAVIVEHALPQARSPADVPLPDEARPLYARALSHMRGFGKEFAELITGQRPDLAEALNADGAPEH